MSLEAAKKESKKTYSSWGDDEMLRLATWYYVDKLTQQEIADRRMAIEMLALDLLLPLPLRLG